MTEKRGSQRSLFSISKNGEFFGTCLGESEAATTAEAFMQSPHKMEPNLTLQLSDLAIGESLDIGCRVVVTRIKPVVFPGGKICRDE